MWPGDDCIYGTQTVKLGFALYHLGRILAYVFIGTLLGIIGAAVGLFQFQKVMVFILGFGLILLYGIPTIRHALERRYYESKFYQLLKSFLVKNLSMRKRWFLSGVANGFFPCGLTYVAAAGAVALASPLNGALYMVVFGLGTLPSLVIVSFAGHLFTKKMKSLIPRSLASIAILSGLLLVLRHADSISSVQPIGSNKSSWINYSVWIVRSD